MVVCCGGGTDALDRMGDQHGYWYLTGRECSRELVARFHAATHLYRPCHPFAQDTRGMDCCGNGGGRSGIGRWPAPPPGGVGGGAPLAVYSAGAFSKGGWVK